MIGHRYIGRSMKGRSKVGKDIGQWKVERRNTKFNEFIELSKLENEEVKVEDEWDTEAI